MGWGGGIPLIENAEHISTGLILSVELQNTKLPFHLFFLTRLLPDSRFSKSDKTKLKDGLARVFSEILDV